MRGYLLLERFRQHAEGARANLEIVHVPPEAYDRSFPGAPEIRETFQYFEEQTYFGPQREAHIAAANALVPGGFTTLADWARCHMNPIADASVGD